MLWSREIIVIMSILSHDKIATTSDGSIFEANTSEFIYNLEKKPIKVLVM